jgi:hypothetical protein
MMKLIYYAITLLLLTGVTACGDDNYEFPAETFRGTIVDAETGEPFQTAVGNTGVRIKMMEYSWSENPTPYYMHCMMDGVFNNTKVFRGQYGVLPEGAFVPLEEEIIDISGVVEKQYEVDPFLRVKWVGEPTLNADGTASVRVTIERGTADPDYQQNLVEAWLFVSEVQYVGDFSYSTNYSTKLTGATLPVLGETTTITTGWPGGIGVGSQRKFPDYARKYFLRVGARINKQVNSTNVYNYSTIKEITTH